MALSDAQKKAVMEAIEKRSTYSWPNDEFKGFTLPDGWEQQIEFQSYSQDHPKVEFKGLAHEVGDAIRIPILVEDTHGNKSKTYMLSYIATSAGF